jgi:hypothetical protein
MLRAARSWESSNAGPVTTFVNLTSFGRTEAGTRAGDMNFRLHLTSSGAIHFDKEGCGTTTYDVKEIILTKRI